MNSLNIFCKDNIAPVLFITFKAKKNLGFCKPKCTTITAVLPLLLLQCLLFCHKIIFVTCNWSHFCKIHIYFQNKPSISRFFFSSPQIIDPVFNVPLSDGWFCLPFSKEGRFLKIQIRKSIKYSKKEKHTP